jgi:hypothetical protein
VSGSESSGSLASSRSLTAILTGPRAVSSAAMSPMRSVPTQSSCSVETLSLVRFRSSPLSRSYVEAPLCGDDCFEMEWAASNQSSPGASEGPDLPLGVDLPAAKHTPKDSAWDMDADEVQDEVHGPDQTAPESRRRDGFSGKPATKSVGPSSGPRRAAPPRPRARRKQVNRKAAGEAEGDAVETTGGDGEELPVISEPGEMFLDMVRCSCGHLLRVPTLYRCIECCCSVIVVPRRMLHCTSCAPLAWPTLGHWQARARRHWCKRTLRLPGTDADSPRAGARSLRAASLAVCAGSVKVAAGWANPQWSKARVVDYSAIQSA